MLNAARWHCFRFVFLLLALFALISAFPVAAAAPCADDPRLSELPALLRSGTVPESPLILTPETFARLHPAVRKALGGNVVICPAIPLNSQGRPLIRPLKTAFPDLWDAVVTAVSSDDWEEVTYLRDNFVANPLPVEAVFSLLTVPPYGEKSMKMLAKIMGITPFSKDNWQFFALDIFHGFGGIVEKPVRVGITNSYRELSQACSKAEALRRTEIFMVYSGNLEKEAIRSLQRCGVTAVAIRNFF